LDKIEPEIVRKWHADLTVRLCRELTPRSTLNGNGAARCTDGTVTVARAYRLLRSILQTAVDDELLVRQPCRISGAGEARSTERPVLSATEIATLATEVPAHYRAFVTASGRDVLDGYSQVIRRALDGLGRSDARMHDRATRP
jgi:hypothetical protein